MTPEKNPWDAETVYALLQHVDEATYVRGIFSTKEKAQRAQNDLTGESKYEDDLIQKRLPSRRALVREAGVPRKDGNYPETLSSIIHGALQVLALRGDVVTVETEYHRFWAVRTPRTEAAVAELEKRNKWDRWRDRILGFPKERPVFTSEVLRGWTDEEERVKAAHRAKIEALSTRAEESLRGRLGAEWVSEWTIRDFLTHREVRFGPIHYWTWDPSIDHDDTREAVDLCLEKGTVLRAVDFPTKGNVLLAYKNPESEAALAAWKERATKGAA
jgi:hypothetical protein